MQRGMAQLVALRADVEADALAFVRARFPRISAVTPDLLTAEMMPAAVNCGVMHQTEAAWSEASPSGPGRPPAHHGPAVAADDTSSKPRHRAPCCRGPGHLVTVWHTDPARILVNDDGADNPSDQGNHDGRKDQIDGMGRHASAGSHGPRD